MELTLMGVREKRYLSHGTVGCLPGRALLDEPGQSSAQYWPWESWDDVVII